MKNALTLLILISIASLVSAQESGVGLVTTEGPSGLFMNPTSGTISKQAYTAQYCFWLPDTIESGHNGFIAYGLTEDLEVGVVGTYRNGRTENSSAVGPSLRYRVVRDDGKRMPEISLGAYGMFGDDPVQKVSGYAAAFRRIPINPRGMVRAVGLHGGVRVEDAEIKDDTSTRAYFGLDVQLPARFHLVGEIMTEDEDDGDDGVPYAFGAQWRASGFNISLSGVENQVSDGSPYLFFGIGTVHSF